MRSVIVFLTAGMLAWATLAHADLFPGEEPVGETGVTLNPVRAGRLEVIPILSVGISDGSVVYQGGVSVGYSLSRLHQIGGSFVAGNQANDRWGDRRELIETPRPPVQTTTGYAVSAEDGFGCSMAGFYRLNIPLKVDRRTSPFLEAFAARDFWGWDDIGEVGGGIGLRRVLSYRTALTTRYSYVALFTGGRRLNRHVATVGVSMFFR